MVQLISNIYETGQWSKDFTEVTIIALKKPRAAKCSEHCTISLTAHDTKTVMRILGRSIEKKIEGVIGQDQFGCRR
jgi:hypothetical protein